jgi:hypothetical protein
MSDRNHLNIDSSESESSCDSIKIKIKRSISKTSTTNRRSQRRRIVKHINQNILFLSLSLLEYSTTNAE